MELHRTREVLQLMLIQTSTRTRFKFQFMIDGQTSGGESPGRCPDVDIQCTDVGVSRNPAQERDLDLLCLPDQVLVHVYFHGRQGFQIRNCYHCLLTVEGCRRRPLKICPPLWHTYLPEENRTRFRHHGISVLCRWTTEELSKDSDLGAKFTRTKMEFQAVIMAAGRGSRMTDLSNNIPKALLPIGNHPMIWYPISMLEKAGFERVIIITLESVGKDLRQKLKSCGEIKLELDIVTIPNDEDWGTAESLRHIRDKIKTDVLVISSDLITDIELHLLADIHRKYDSTITALLYQQSDQGLEGMTVPGTRSKKKSDQRDIIGLDEKGQRMLLMTAEADVEVSLPLKMSLLRKFPCIQFETRLLDAHMYFLKKWVVDFLADSKQGRNLATLKGEVLPYLVKKQFSRISHLSKADDKESSIINVKQDGQLDLSKYLPYDEMSKKVLEMSPWNAHKGEMSKVYQKGDNLRCYTYVASSGMCLRANNVAAYCEANRQVTAQRHLLGEEPLVHPSVSKSKSSGIGKDCMVGERSNIGDQVSVKRSIIGRHCTIGDKVKINNSVIMDHVTINEGCVIQGTILCPSAHINKNVDLKDCIVGTSQNVVEGASYNGEVIGEGDMMMEI